MDDGPTVNRGNGRSAPPFAAQPSVLLAAAKWWPLSARLASALALHGCKVAAVCPRGHPLTHVLGIERVYRYGGILSLVSLQRAIRDRSPDIIVPCDEGVVAQLHAIHRRDPSLRSLIERSLGPPSSFPTVQSRHRLLALAEQLGVRVPRTRRVLRLEDLTEWHREVPGMAVLKVAGESAGNGVLFSHSPDESVKAWRKLSTPIGLAAAWKRFLIDGNPLTIWQHRAGPENEVTIQEFVGGRPANSMILCRDGAVLAILSVIVVAAESAVGAATVVRIIDDLRMSQAAERLAHRLQLSGFYGLDFMVDESGAPILIELNPRCTQLGHFDLPGRASLAAAFAASLRGRAPSAPDNPIRHDMIALFPQALAAGSVCAPYIAVSHHDVPDHEPALKRELELPSWPQRQWPWRFYHALSSVHRGDPVAFEPPPAAAGDHKGPINGAAMHAVSNRAR